MKSLKWVGIGLGTLILALLIFLLVVYFNSQARLTKVYEIPVEPVIIPTDAASISRGRHIFQFRGCKACHSSGEVSILERHQATPRMEGHVYLDDPAIGQVVASNLTSGKGGVGGEYTDADWVRLIRHGVRPDGTPLLFMPSTEFYYLSDEDLGDVIAYIKSAPPVDNQLPASSLSVTGRLVMTLLPGMTFIPAELIPHTAPRPSAPPVGVTPEYGEYLTYSCKVCHGSTMSGGKIPGFPPDYPPAPNLTWGVGSALPTWSEADFINTIRSGSTHAGVRLRGEYMPWRSFEYMSDDELRAVWVYLKSLPPKEYGNR